MRPFIASFVTSHVEDSSERPSNTVEAGLKPGPLYLNPLSDALHWISLYTATSRLVIVLLLLLVNSGKFVLKSKEIRGINLFSPVKSKPRPRTGNDDKEMHHVPLYKVGKFILL